MSENLHSTTPLGQELRGKDLQEIQDIAPLLRRDFPTEIKRRLSKDSDPPEASRIVWHLISTHKMSQHDPVNIWQSERIGGTDPRTLEFFSTKLGTPDNFKALFEILKACDIKREDAISAGNDFISLYLVRTHNLSLAESEKLGELAMNTLNDVYATK